MGNDKTENASIIQKWSIVFGPLCKLGETIFELLTPYLMISLITLMSSKQSESVSYIETIKLLLRNSKFQLIILLSLLNGILAIAAQYFASKAATDYTAKL